MFPQGSAEITHSVRAVRVTQGTMASLEAESECEGGSQVLFWQLTPSRPRSYSDRSIAGSPCFFKCLRLFFQTCFGNRRHRLPLVSRFSLLSCMSPGELPAMTSSSSMSLSPSLKSSSMFSICVPDFLRWELHHAVNVCAMERERERENRNRRHVVIIQSLFLFSFSSSYHNTSL